MEKMKRTIALVGALAMVFSFTPVSGYLPEASVVMEAKAEEYGDWEYEVLEDRTAEITGTPDGFAGI